jgi:hypothetical protein
MAGETLTALVVLHLLPIPVALWASWKIWRLGRPAAQREALRDAVVLGECRRCGAPGVVHRKTGRCDPCHRERLPGPESVPDALPEDLRLPIE